MLSIRNTFTILPIRLFAEVGREYATSRVHSTVGGGADHGDVEGCNRA